MFFAQANLDFYQPSAKNYESLIGGYASQVISSILIPGSTLPSMVETKLPDNWASYGYLGSLSGGKARLSFYAGINLLSLPNVNILNHINNSPKLFRLSPSLSFTAPTNVGGIYLKGAGDSLNHLGNLTGIAYDEKNSRLILLSEQQGQINLPPLRMDDVVTVFRSVYQQGNAPFVSILDAKLSSETRPCHRHHSLNYRQI